MRKVSSLEGDYDFFSAKRDEDIALLVGCWEKHIALILRWFGAVDCRKRVKDKLSEVINAVSTLDILRYSAIRNLQTHYLVNLRQRTIKFKNG
ncbi:MAG: hypothetical protein U9R02_06870 [Thermodesulfobacteriota bacterium]|nr:hypothetical protein [Thermodesulfobacteriota bacterium]